MTHPSSQVPDGLLQATVYTDAVAVIIQRLVDGTETEPVIAFTQAPEVQDFYAKRGVGLGITQQTNLTTLQLLAHELLTTAHHQQKVGLDSAPVLVERARKLQAATHTLTKDDALICSFELRSPNDVS